MLKRFLLAIGVATILSAVFLVGLVSGRVTRRPKAPDLDDPQLWLPIKVFHGTLDPDSGKVDAIVSAAFRLSDDRYPYTVMQNKIEIKSAGGRFTYLWPDDKIFVAGWC